MPAFPPCPTKRDVADQIFSVYGLVARFGLILDTAVELEWKKQKPSLPEEITDEEQDAIETGLANGIRARLFADIESAITSAPLRSRASSQGYPRKGCPWFAIALNINDVSLLRLNINVLVALEDFLLASLRTWSRR